MIKGCLLFIYYLFIYLIFLFSIYSYHLSCLCKEHNVYPHEVLLIDDREKNCYIAMKEGYYSIKVKGKQGFQFDQLALPKKM